MSTTSGAICGMAKPAMMSVLVLVVGQHLVEHVGGVLVAGIDAGAADFGLLEAVGVERDEDVGLVGARQSDALVEPQEGVVLARQRHVEAAGVDQQFLQLQRKGEDDVLFV